MTLVSAVQFFLEISHKNIEHPILSYFCLLSVYLVLLACDLVYLILYYLLLHQVAPSTSLIAIIVLSCMPYMHQKILKKS